MAKAESTKPESGRRMRRTGTGKLIEATLNIHVVKDPEEFKAAEEAGRLFARLGSVWILCCTDEFADKLYGETWAGIDGMRIIRHRA